MQVRRRTSPAAGHDGGVHCFSARGGVWTSGRAAQRKSGVQRAITRHQERFCCPRTPDAGTARNFDMVEIIFTCSLGRPSTLVLHVHKFTCSTRTRPPTVCRPTLTRNLIKKVFRIMQYSLSVRVVYVSAGHSRFNCNPCTTYRRLHMHTCTYINGWIFKGAQFTKNRSASKWPVKIGHCITDMHPHGAKKVPVLGLSSSFLLVFFL